MRFFRRGGGDGDEKQKNRRLSLDDGLFPEITLTKKRRSKRESLWRTAIEPCAPVYRDRHNSPNGPQSAQLGSLQSPNLRAIVVTVLPLPACGAGRASTHEQWRRK